MCDGRALGADAHAAAERPPAGVDVDADAQRSLAASAGAPVERAVDQVELLDAVDHHAHAALRAFGGELGERAQRAPVGGRVGDEQVLGAVVGEPQGLGQGEGERAREPGAGEDAFLQGAAADGLAREADRLGGGAADEVVGVGPQRVEVDERERRLQLGGGALETFELRDPGRG